MTDSLFTVFHLLNTLLLQPNSLASRYSSNICLENHGVIEALKRHARKFSRCIITVFSLSFESLIYEAVFAQVSFSGLHSFL